jgi:hypothetical protein
VQQLEGVLQEAGLQQLAVVLEPNVRLSAATSAVHVNSMLAGECNHTVLSMFEFHVPCNLPAYVLLWQRCAIRTAVVLLPHALLPPHSSKFTCIW